MPSRRLARLLGEAYHPSRAEGQLRCAARPGHSAPSTPASASATPTQVTTFHKPRFAAAVCASATFRTSFSTSSRSTTAVSGAGDSASVGSDGDEHPATLNVERHTSATAAAPARTRMWSPLYRRFKPPSLYLPLVRFSDMSHRVFALPASLARRATAPVLASTVVGVVLGVVTASIGFARRVAHLVEVEHVGEAEYAVRGQLFFASSNDLVYAFDYTLDTQRVVIDMSKAEVWDASTVATLDAVQKKYAERGIEVEFRGLEGASAQRLNRLSGRLGD